MDQTFVPVEREEILHAVTKCFETGTSGAFLETIKSRLEDPTAPMVVDDGNNEQNKKTRKRTYHPLVWTFGIAVAGVIGIVLLFTFKS